MSRGLGDVYKRQVLAEESIKAAVKNYYDRNNIPYDHSKFPDCEHCEGGCPMV